MNRHATPDDMSEGAPDNAPEQNLVIVREAGEMALKSPRVRRRFQERLHRNVADALTRDGIEHRLKSQLGRLLLATPQREAALAALSRVFGVSSFSPVEATAPAELAAIVAAGARTFAGQVAGRRYAVRAKRLGPHSLSRQAIERELGAALNPYGTVDLSNPEITVSVDFQGHSAWLYGTRAAGPGGLPAGVQGRAVALLSGGFDSPVAAWQVMRRGVELDFVFCNLGGRAHERMVLQVAKVLSERWCYGLAPRFYAVDFTGLLDELRAAVRTDYWQIVLKRLMYRAACLVARETGAQAIVTGEALGQVSSQTLSNLNSIDSAASLPVLRPLIGSDKQDLIDAARRIGTAPLSERMKEYCAIVPRRPATSSRRPYIEREEAKLDLTRLGAAVRAAKIIDLNAVTAVDLRAPYLFVEEIPAGAIPIDCQPRHMHAHWHLPGALHIEADELVAKLGELDKAATYLLYCPFGTQTPYLAEIMQQRGFDAYAFRGGLSVLKRQHESGNAGEAASP